MTVRVKICGITRVEDARAAIDAGADMIGLNFYAKTPRYIDLDRAREIRASVGSRATVVGVFVDAERAYIDERLREAALDHVSARGRSGQHDANLCAGLERGRLSHSGHDAATSIACTVAPAGASAPRLFRTVTSERVPLTV